MDNVFERLDMLRPIGVPKDAGPRPAPPPADSLTPDAFRALLALSQIKGLGAGPFFEFSPLANYDACTAG